MSGKSERFAHIISILTSHQIMATLGQTAIQCGRQSHIRGKLDDIYHAWIGLLQAIERQLDLAWNGTITNDHQIIRRRILAHYGFSYNFV